jgi:hypothetical protein
MQLSFGVVVAWAAALASAGVVIIPVESNQVVAANNGDCFFGVVTPLGCA